jgi:hypothetical protein
MLSTHNSYNKKKLMLSTRNSLRLPCIALELKVKPVLKNFENNIIDQLVVPQESADVGFLESVCVCVCARNYRQIVYVLAIEFKKRKALHSVK